MSGYVPPGIEEVCGTGLLGKLCTRTLLILRIMTVFVIRGSEFLINLGM